MPEPTPLPQRLAYLTEILIAFAASPIPSHLLQTLADYAYLAMPYDFFAIGLVDPDEAGYLVHALGGTRPVAPLPARPVPLPDGLIGQVMADGKLQRTTDVLAVVTPTALETACAAAGLPHALVVPLRQADRKIGALFFAAAPPYTADDAQIGLLLGSALSAHFEMSRLYQILADERSTLTAVLESAQDGLLVVNPNGRILLANPAAQQMFALDNTCIGRPLFAVLPDHSLLALFEQDELADVELTLADGRIVHAHRHAVVSGFGEHVGWAVVLHDVTLQQQLAQMKNEFVHTVSHDLKNPIGTVLLAAELLPAAGPLNVQQADLQQRITRTAHYMNALVTDLLDLGKLDAGLGLEPAPLDLAALLHEVLDALQPKAAAKSITLDTHLPDACKLIADAKRLRQLFLNLVGNAVKYTPAGGGVTVTLRARDGAVAVDVTDTGIGIPAADLPHIFDKFYRVRGAASADVEGTGLGLAIAQSIAEAHNGRIAVRSREGEGSTFTVTLPAAVGSG
ncbi:MAG: PAS domain-containing protein [Anaerolineales bacterium]|nr:PAS domain-containing protein [Anaerolineales bacterium]